MASTWIACSKSLLRPRSFEKSSSTRNRAREIATYRRLHALNSTGEPSHLSSRGRATPHHRGPARQAEDLPSRGRSQITGGTWTMTVTNHEYRGYVFTL